MHGSTLRVAYQGVTGAYSEAAAAAAVAAAETDEDEDDEEEEETGEPNNFRRNGQLGESDGLRNLARAIETFGEVYARVEIETNCGVGEAEDANARGDAGSAGED